MGTPWWPGQKTRQILPPTGSRIARNHARALHLRAYAVWCNGVGAGLPHQAWLSAKAVLDCLLVAGLLNGAFQWVGR